MQANSALCLQCTSVLPEPLVLVVLWCCEDLQIEKVLSFFLPVRAGCSHFGQIGLHQLGILPDIRDSLSSLRHSYRRWRNQCYKYI